jgi:hypothetical protein
LNDLRNQVAHPTKPLLSKEHDIQQLNKRLERIEELLFKLRQKKQA